MKLPLPRVACPHSTSAATTSRPKPCPCALSLSQRPSSGETESASSNEAMPRHSLLSSRRMTKENLFGSGASTLFSHRVTYSLHDGGSHGINLAMAGVMHPKTSRASNIWNWLSCNLGDWMTIIVSAYQRRKMHTLEVKLLWVQTTQKASIRFSFAVPTNDPAPAMDRIASGYSADSTHSGWRPVQGNRDRQSKQQRHERLRTIQL